MKENLLHTAQEILALPPGKVLRWRTPDESAALRAVAEWARHFLCTPHPELGRGGPVCPYVETSIKKDLFWLTLAQTASANVALVRRTVLHHREVFLERAPREGSDAFFKTILILFPDVTPDDAPQVIDGLQRSLKLAFVKHDLMIGEFHTRNNSPGLWNEDFRPLRSPIPMLAIRFMVVSDLPFLVRTLDHTRAYLERFGDEGRKRLRTYIEQHGDRLPLAHCAALLAELTRGNGR